jgi:hypothetical protein
MCNQLNWQDDYVYSSFDILLDTLAEKCCFLLPQMSSKAGLKQFGNKGATAIMKELAQFITMDVTKGCFAHQLIKEQQKKALQYLMFLKEKKMWAYQGLQICQWS